MSSFEYPVTLRGHDVAEAAGERFEDPYRWLEQDTEAVRDWQAQQNRLADAYVKEWPHYGELERSISRYLVDRIGALPRFVAGQWFRVNQPTEQASASITVSAEPYGSGRELKLEGVDQGACAFVSWIAPAPDGRIVAFGVCVDGSENNRILLIDVSSGKLLPKAPAQQLMDAWMGGVCWLPDATGFFYLGLEGDAQDFRQRTMFFDLKTGHSALVDIPLPDPSSTDYTLVTVSRDGRYLVASHGLQAPKPVAICDLRESKPSWRPFVTRVTGTVNGFVHEGSYFAVTDVGAPRGRVVRIAIDANDPNDTAEWQEVYPESSFVLRSLKPVGACFYLSGFADTYSEVRVLDQHGALLRKVSLPGRGAVAEPLFPLMTHVPSGHPDEYLFVFSSFVESWGVYRHRPGASAVETIRAPAVKIDHAVISDHWAVSADGTRIPYHTVRLERVASSEPAPALIYAYGAFNVALLPEYPGAMAAFIQAGGVYVHGHIRGGAELGLDWWRGGRMKNKQNCFHDLYAIAEDLIAKGVTSREKLAMTGRSNGGLMAGVALAQRPDLWRAIVSQVPVSDLIGILRDAYGRYALASEYADPSDPQEILRLASFSPYHLVKKGTRYPSLLIDAGATDPRCPPWHARKLAAVLQAANAADTPVLLRVRENAGHGFATPKAIQLAGYTQWLAFLMRELQMVPESAA